MNYQQFLPSSDANYSCAKAKHGVLFFTAVFITLLFSAAAFAEELTPVTSAQTFSDPDQLNIRAEQMTGRPARVASFDGDVEVVKGATTINSDTAKYHVVEDLVTANGHVKMRKKNDCYFGDALQMRMETGEGYLSSPVYQLEKNNARGSADRIEFVDEDRSMVDQAIYTTCQGTTPDWYLKSSRLNLDTDRDEGVALGGVVYFKEVPILASPWMSFPITASRRSGALPPEYNSTTAGGIELSVPYYLDIAPNRDATLFPKYISKRGMQLGGEFRYLEPHYVGKFNGETTPHDHLTDSTRYMLSFQHTQKFSLPGLSMALSYNRASDNQYAIDYGHSITESSQHLLPQSFSLDYSNRFGSVGLSTLNYQVLQDVNQSIVKPYQILPRLYAQSSGVDVLGGFDWAQNTEYTHFVSSTLVDGERLALNGQLSYPLTGSYYFVTPKVLYHLSTYRLKNNLAAGQATIFPSTTSLSVPTFSLDSGLYFDRDTRLFGRPVTQTLEPRLFYVRTPFRDQTDIPLFDTGLSDINFSQLFTENRFTGQDRVSDANQITAGLVSRIIEMDGQERLRLGIAQRYSFSQPAVVDKPFFPTTTLINGQSVTALRPTLPSRSDIILAAHGKLTDALSVNAVWLYNQSQHGTSKMSYGVRWQPAPMKVINAQYRFQEVSEVNPEVLRQIDISAQWPIAPRWYGVARMNYSIEDQRVLDQLVGFEYQQDCWIFRAVAQRYMIPSTIATVTSGATTSVFLQLELNGLSKIGTNPLDFIKRSIPGYQPINSIR